MKPAAHDPILDALPALLRKLDRPGDFFGTGSVELPVVRFAVAGVGDLGLPIPAAQGEALRAAAEDAPYGRGARTLVDKTVRRCGQFDAGAVKADDPRWRATLDAIVAEATAALGVSGAVTAELYKLLVYGPGDFFVEHRDTEKAKGMFATLIVALPSAHAGGELVVRHEGREARATLAGDDLGVARWAAFYCDCAHELAPLTAGYRVALVYNLIRRARSTPRPPDVGPVRRELAEALGAWARRAATPPKVVLPLAHRYTLAELDFRSLKSHDAASAQALTAAAHDAGCTVRLALLSIRESGAAEPEWDGGWRSRRHRDDDDGEENRRYEVVEVFEHSCSLREWRSPDGGREDYGAIAVDDDAEVAPPDALEGAEPDEDQLHEAMGNGGASFERTYRWAALVVWPDAREIEVLRQGGRAALLGALERHMGSDRPRALTLARQIVTSWSTLGTGRDDLAALHARALRLFVALGDRALVADLLGAIAAAGGLAGSRGGADSAAAGDEDLDDEELDDEELDDEELDDEELHRTSKARLADDGVAPRSAAAPSEPEVDAAVGAIAAVSADDARRLAVALVAARAGSPLRTLASFLRGAAMARRDDAMREPVEALARALAAMKAPPAYGVPSFDERAEGLAELLRAAEAAGGAKLAQRSAQVVVEAGHAAPLDAVLVPCALSLGAAPGRPPAASVQPLVDACQRHLEARCALPLAPPADAAREADGITCGCAHCQSLATFLRDPVSQRWQLKAAQSVRSHVEDVAARARVDVATSTVRSGSPHMLVCTKTTARHQARVAQRAADTAALAALAAWRGAR